MIVFVFSFTEYKTCLGLRPRCPVRLSWEIQDVDGRERFKKMTIFFINSCNFLRFF